MRTNLIKPKNISEAKSKTSNDGMLDMVIAFDTTGSMAGCISSVKEYYRGRKITGIFQPHLFSRTLDHYKGFAAILDVLDETILLPIYPAREKPIEGVSSELILNNMKSGKKRLKANFWSEGIGMLLPFNFSCVSISDRLIHALVPGTNSP